MADFQSMGLDICIFVPDLGEFWTVFKSLFFYDSSKGRFQFCATVLLSHVEAKGAVCSHLRSS